VEPGRIGPRLAGAPGQRPDSRSLKNGAQKSGRVHRKRILSGVLNINLRIVCPIGHTLSCRKGPVALAKNPERNNCAAGPPRTLVHAASEPPSPSPKPAPDSSLLNGFGIAGPSSKPITFPTMRARPASGTERSQCSQQRCHRHAATHSLLAPAGSGAGQRRGRRVCVPFSSGPPPATGVDKRIQGRLGRCGTRGRSGAAQRAPSRGFVGASFWNPSGHNPRSPASGRGPPGHLRSSGCSPRRRSGLASPSPPTQRPYRPPRRLQAGRGAGVGCNARGAGADGRRRTRRGFLATAGRALRGLPATGQFAAAAPPDQESGGGASQHRRRRRGQRCDGSLGQSRAKIRGETQNRGLGLRLMSRVPSGDLRRGFARFRAKQG